MAEPHKRTVSPRDLANVRARLELQAGLALLTGALMMAIVIGSIIVSKWFAGVLYDPAERVFWAGAVLAGLMVAAFAAAAFPGGDDDAAVIRRIRVFMRLGLLLFILSPALCIGALVADFYR